MAASWTEAGYSLHEELELLEAIYIHELTVEGPQERPDSLSVLLHPSTGDEEHKQYVCLTLVIILTDKYPESCPSLSIKAPRGLSDAHVSSILSNLRELAESRLGGPMLYELIEYAKESLTDNNVPSCACAICLCHFQDSDSFTRTECYHYFHCNCLLRFIDYSLQVEDTEGEHSEQVECPVCRLPVTYDLNVLRESGSVASELEEDRYEADEATKKLQKKMASLYAQQRKKGGIIDVERERNKFLIGISSPKAASPESDPSADGIHRGDKRTETLEEPDKPVGQDRREQQGYGKKGGSSNKHKRGGKKPATGGTVKEVSKENVRTETTEATRQVEDKQRERANKTRDGGKMSDRKDNETAFSYRDSCVDDRGTKKDEKQRHEQRENQNIRERKSKPKSASKKWRPGDERNFSADLKIGGRRENGSSKTKNREESSGKENPGSLETPAIEVRLPIENLDSNTNKKQRRPLPGFVELPGGSGSVRRPVKPPPGFERATNGAGGHSSGPKKAAPPVVKDEDINLNNSI